MQALIAPGQARGQVQALVVPPLQERGRTISVESLVFLFDHPVRTLFDSGTSHSFISTSLVESLHFNTSLVEDPLVVSNPIGGSTDLSMMCLDLKISILSIEFRCDAYVLGFTGYGLILGMDWLSKHDAQIDCQNKKVMVKTPDERIVTFKAQNQVKKF